ncbi:MAG TPA: cytochrome c [Rhodothermales bacterium]|nr:cytochrome c [Rhodothermales bacterium]
MKNNQATTSPHLALSLVVMLIAVLVGFVGCVEETESVSDGVAETGSPSDSLATNYMVSGRELYETYCASCHGPAAKGDGPVASLLTIPPPDLTQIQQRYGGTFPVDTLYYMIDGRDEVPAHGTREMPIWGNAWRTTESAPQNEEEIEQRINLLIEYLRSIQVEGNGS